MEALILIVIIILFAYIYLIERFTINITVPETETKPRIKEPTGASSLASSPAPINATAKAAANKKDAEGRSPLINAIMGKDVIKVNQLIADGADVNENVAWFTVLIYAFLLNNTDAIKALVVAGANVNTPDKNGATPIIWASTLGNLELVKLLVAKGANVNAKDNIGRTSLKISRDSSSFFVGQGQNIPSKNPDVEAYLLSKGATE
jgi:hypothetical protein